MAIRLVTVLALIAMMMPAGASWAGWDPIVVSGTWNGHMYRAVQFAPAYSGENWWYAAGEAQAWGESLGGRGYLACITSQAENDFILGLMQQVEDIATEQGLPSKLWLDMEGEKWGPWLGGTDDPNTVPEASEGDWKWVSGEEMVYTNWHPLGHSSTPEWGEPDGGVPHSHMHFLRRGMGTPYWETPYWASFMAIERRVLSYIAEIEPAVRTVDIDIKPGSDPNAINLGSKGVVPVAIFSSADFDATQIDPDTVLLGGAAVAVRGKGSKYLSHADDVDADGLLDMVVQVETEQFDLGAGFVQGEVVLTGETYDGQAIEGVDEVVVVP